MPDASLLIEGAARIGHRIRGLAEAQGRGYVWRVVMPARTGDRHATQLGIALEGLYQGSAGVALFLGELAAITGERGLQTLASDALLHTMRPRGAPRRIGLYSGDVGTAYAAARLAAITGDDSLADLAKARVDGLDRAITSDAVFDMIGGAAGSVLGLLAIERYIGVNCLPLAVAMGEHLMAHAQRRRSGWSWAFNNTSINDLCGYAHGASGMTHAFLELFARTGDVRWRFAAQQSLAFERHHAIAGTGDWPDFRCHDAMELYRVHTRDQLRERLRQGESLARWNGFSMRAWCHGSPGIALTRMRAVSLGVDVVECTREATAAVEATRTDIGRTRGRNYSLCHGFFGNAETVRIAEERFGRPRDGFVDELAAAAVREIELEGRTWASGVIGGGFDPSLLVGEAGIGHFLLQLASPSVPSALCISDWRPAPETLVGDDVSLRDTELQRMLPRVHGAVRLIAGLNGVRETVAAARNAGDSMSERVEAVASAILAAPPNAGTTCLREALALDLARLDAEHRHTDFLEQTWRELKQLTVDEVDWQHDRFTLAPTTELHRTRWDWHTMRDHAAPVESAGMCVIYRTGRYVKLQPVAPALGAVLEALQHPRTIAECVAATRDTIDADDATAAALPGFVESSLRSALAMGIVEALT